MTNHPDPVTLLEQIYDHTERVLAEIGPDQYELPTPCTEWNVLEVVNHMIGADRSMDPAVAEAVLAASQMIISDELRGDRFAPAVPIADDAPAHDRLAAFLGRQPA